MVALSQLLVFLWAGLGWGYHYDPDYVAYNLNTNQTAREPTDYWGERLGGHQYTPSPANWRFPYYTIFLDRFVNGDPYNDNINGTYFEHDISSNQMRHGGDLQGLLDTLDYLQGMGIKGLYVAGSILINAPWQYDGYSPLDLSLLDAHFGDLAMWKYAIDEIHARGMYVVLDNTFATMGDLIGFEGYLNTTTPFSINEHPVLWKSGRRYLDFDIGNNYNTTCEYPRFYNETGYLVDEYVTDSLKGCYDSDFDQYGDTEAFGVYPDWRRQITKFASVQDRLREWHPPVRAKLENFYCMIIAQLDIDGFRYDKAMQSTVDALGYMNQAMRACAKRYGKNNFFLPGELTGGNDIASVWLGRGRSPNMIPANITRAVTAGYTTQDYSIREGKYSALDAAAFHYSVYRALTRFLGMDGNLEAGYDAPLNFVDIWNTIIMTNDLYNINTEQFDPRHMYGVSNQDVFRWPAIANGTQRQLLGHFITSLLMPGSPLIIWGEEQAFYVLDNTADNYIFGRQPISAASAWQTHGCYSMGSVQYFDWPIESARQGCRDDTVSYDHRDPSAPLYNTLRHMFHLRDTYSVLNDGAWLQQLSNQTWQIFRPGSNGIATETGLWSVMRSGIPTIQNFGLSNKSAAAVWLLYSNNNETKNYVFNCSDTTPVPHTNALLSPYDAGTRVKNLLYPYDEFTLQASGQRLGINSSAPTGCNASMLMEPWGFRAYVPLKSWVAPKTVITKFFVNDDTSLGHDSRIVSQTNGNGEESVTITLHFSNQTNCSAITESISFQSTTNSGRAPSIDKSTVKCAATSYTPGKILQGMIYSTWSWRATVVGVENGVHRVTVGNATKDSIDHFLFRIGQTNNPVIFPRSANYSTSLLHKDSSGTMYLQHAAAGADLWRYSTNWGSSFSAWRPFTGDNTTIEELAWHGTDNQRWKGSHVRVEYFSRLAGTSDIIQEGDLNVAHARRFPHLFWNGEYNLYGYDSGLENTMHLEKDSVWHFPFMTEWPTVAQVNVWGLNPDGQPDQTYVMGDADGDAVLDRLPPSALAPPVVNITIPPPSKYVGWAITIHDGTLRFAVDPLGSAHRQIWIFALLWTIPIICALISVYAFMKGFYQIKFNKVGRTDAPHYAAYEWVRRRLNKLFLSSVIENDEEKEFSGCLTVPCKKFRQSTFAGVTKDKGKRRTVLIGTMEYDIEDWSIKVKIGGLGVMAQLMGKALTTMDLIWVIPCVGGVKYPVDTPAEPMKVTILGVDYSIQVQYHQYNNIKYVLLDAPVFRQQTQAEPYPARMDDLTSAIYYSAWNQCIAQAIKRFPIDLYHINDYHGCIAPLYLLPRSIPVCLSLHNAEFQGLWPMRTPEECAEVTEVFNLNPDVVQRFVQFGEVFNMLHAGASYLRVYQQGFGAVGVSSKYGRRAYLRYPIFWGLKKIGKLPNPDPTDTAAWDGRLPQEKDMLVDDAFEAERPSLRLQAQRWAGLEEDPKAELFVFVGRWSQQKGIDLIADVFPMILKKHPKTQLICIGPVIDLYGKFAALKLDMLMKKYPKRVFSRPVFTQIPPCVFSGAEFALIPSRDEPFGLVAVEFGRKGALGVGARVGGLGNMPGWWYTVEAVTSQHLIGQFVLAIEEALSSQQSMRALMRARAAKQRFPVVQWVENLQILQSTALRIHGRNLRRTSYRPTPSTRRVPTTSPKAIQILGIEEILEEDSESTDIEMSNPTSRRTSFSRPKVASYRSSSNQSLTSYTSDATLLDTDAVIGEKRDFFLQQVDPFFTDSQGNYFSEYEGKLQRAGDMTGQELWIEDYLVKSEKDWFTMRLNAKLGIEGKSSAVVSYSGTATPVKRTSIAKSLSRKSPAPSTLEGTGATTQDGTGPLGKLKAGAPFEEFLLGEDYKAPKYLRKWMQLRIGDWPIYSFLLALGQIMAANSYQITLLTGQIGQAAERVYVLCTIYLVASLIFWLLLRRVQCATLLSIPFALYGMAFVFIAFARFAPTVSGRGWVQNCGTGLYAAASASGSLFFTLNFGDEGGSTTQSWIFRACVIQGTQQLYITVLWFWGSYLDNQRAHDLLAVVGPSGVINSWKVTAICFPIGVALWLVGAVLYLGLPNYYRQIPGRIPSFYQSVLRRRVIIWFFVAVLIQNFFLSSQYGRSCMFLWKSQHVSYWKITCLVAGFLLGVWSILMWGFSVLSKSHSWILPILAVGLGAPRWAQIWWGVSGMAAWLPWTHSYATSALVARALWLWLGLLDTIQSIGIGMILLSTMTRIHVAFTLLTAQVLGAAVTAIARACAPNSTGPGPIFPNILVSVSYLGNAWFWTALILNCGLCVGFFMFFRKEQLTKP